MSLQKNSSVWEKILIFFTSLRSLLIINTIYWWFFVITFGFFVGGLESITFFWFAITFFPFLSILSVAGFILLGRTNKLGNYVSLASTVLWTLALVAFNYITFSYDFISENLDLFVQHPLFFGYVTLFCLNGLLYLGLIRSWKTNNE